MPIHLQLAGDKIPTDAQVHAYQAHEGVSLPFAVDVEISTADASFRIDDCLQHRVLLEVDDGQGNVRHYDGVPDQVGFRAPPTRRCTAARLLRRSATVTASPSARRQRS